MAESHVQKTHDYGADPKGLDQFVDKAIYLHESQQQTSSDIWRYMHEEQVKQRELNDKKISDRFFDGTSVSFEQDATGKLIGSVVIDDNLQTTKLDAGDAATAAKLSEFQSAHQLASETVRSEYKDGTWLNQDQSIDREGKLWSSIDLLRVNDNVTIMTTDMRDAGLPTTALTYSKGEQSETVEFRDRAKNSALPPRLSSVWRLPYPGASPTFASFDLPAANLSRVHASK